jgi:hypothetical protein
VFDKRLLKKIFGSKSGDMAGDLEISRNEGFHDFYSSPNIICVIKSRKIEGVVHVTRTNKWKLAYRGLVGKLEGIRPHERPSYRREDTNKMDF